MFANLKFRDVFSFPAKGIPPQLYAAGSTQGGAIQVTCGPPTASGPTGNVANFKKWAFILQTGSGAAATTWNAWINGGSGSGGSCSVMLPASSTSTISGSGTYGSAFVVNSTNSAQSYSYLGSNYGSAGVIVMEIRGEYINGLGSNFSWIAPVMSITTGSAYAALLPLAYESGCGPASLYDFNSFNGTGFCLAETDSF
jgi:hypothetical protein